LIPNADGTFSIASQNNLKTKYGVCDEERFSAEPISALCSGFAVRDSLFITAGHCIKGKDIAKLAIVYGFEVNRAGNVNKIIRATDIFQPVKIIKIDSNSLTKDDYCVLRINGKFPPERIAPIRTNGKINDNEDVHLIGYPCGLPVKITPNGKVLNNIISNYFVTNLDSYGGNSGSPVFNSKTHIVEGILVRGNDDFPTTATGSCKRSLICPVNIGNCEGEDVSRTSQFLPWIK
jgi:V8-like Glu-specific endopeptidase